MVSCYRMTTPLAMGFGATALLATALLAMAVESRAETPFATTMIDYAPAPGQWTNVEDFNEPTVALGRPYAEGFTPAGESSLVSLGGFGGSITLRFDHVVMDDLLNPMGLDAIVYGNAFWVDGDVDRHWAECATIEIALDADGSGSIEEGEGWYLIPGSHIVDPLAQYATQTWDDDPETAVPPELLSWIPVGYWGTWTTEAYELPPETFSQSVVENPSRERDVEGIYGYAEYTPTVTLGDTDLDGVIDDPSATPETFYTVPDDPFTTGITPGSGGGDAFDIAWAINAATGEPAELAGFNYIRLVNPTNVALEQPGEKSPEIDAVADVASDPFGDCDGDGDVDLADVVCLQNCCGEWSVGTDWCANMDRNGDEVSDSADVAAFVGRMTGPG